MSANVLTVTDSVDVTKLVNNMWVNLVLNFQCNIWLFVSDGLLVVHFLNDNVRECVDIDEVLNELARLNPSVKFAKVN